MQTVNLNGEKVPLYVRGIQAGYNPESGRWHGVDGRFVTKEEAFGAETRVVGKAISLPSYTEVSRYAEELERIIAGSKPGKSVDPIPPAVTAMMNLAEFYANTEGDVFQTIEVPLDIALKPLDFQSPDSGFQQELEVLYSEANLDMFQNMYYIWLCSGIYGQAFPLLVLDKKNIENTRIVLLSPKNVKVGRSFMMGGNLSVKSPKGQWTEQLLETIWPPLVYNRYAAEWNNAIAEGRDIPIPAEDCYPVREKSLPFQRYATPPIYRAHRAISTRRVFEEMRRATVEGFKNQLWFFRYGDQRGENLPLPEEMKALVDTIEGLYGERTGALIWDGRLSVEVIAPQAPDVLMANETYIGLTMEIFRRLGISLKVVSGERGPLGGSSAKSGDMELDISVLLERLDFKVNQLLRWERFVRARLVEHMGAAAQKANQNTIVRTGMIDMKVQRQIKERLMPAYQSGTLSIQTFLQEGGWDWLVELQRKKDEDKYRHLFSPPATFAQMVVKDTSAPKTVEQETSPGRPDESTKPEVSVQSATEPADDLFAQYVSDVQSLFENHVPSGSIDTFVAQLKQSNQKWIHEIAKVGYREAGGAFEVDSDWVDGAVAYVNSFADGFAERLRAHKDPSALWWNAYLYPQEGRHLGYMYGVQWAMREKGAKAWRRVLHPELSKTGPCEACIADSRITHPITEPFFDLHPNGVCTAEAVAYYTSMDQIPVEIPLPMKIFDKDSVIKKLKELGLKLSDTVVQIVRRVKA